MNVKRSSVLSAPTRRCKITFRLFIVFNASKLLSKETNTYNFKRNAETCKSPQWRPFLAARVMDIVAAAFPDEGDVVNGWHVSLLV